MREEKRWLRLENGLSHFSLLAAKIEAPQMFGQQNIIQLRTLYATYNTSKTK